METLNQLFGSEGRVKILRLFLLNPQEVFEPKEISEKSKTRSKQVRRELNMLSRIGLIHKKTTSIEVIKKKGNKEHASRKKKTGWQTALDFPLLVPLGNLLINTKSLKKETLVQRFSGGGKIKLIIVAGIFIEDENSRADIIIVGDALKKKKLENTMRTLESEIGKELSYAFFETSDFMYRVGVYDKFVRDVLDFPHEKIVNKLGEI